MTTDKKRNWIGLSSVDLSDLEEWVEKYDARGYEVCGGLSVSSATDDQGYLSYIYAVGMKLKNPQ